MTSSDPDPSSSGDPAVPGRGGSAPLQLVARIAESLPLLDEGELNELADAVESLTDAIGLRLDWVAGGAEHEPGDPG